MLRTSNNVAERSCDVAVIGAGAAGLMAAIFAGREGASVLAIDGAPKIGAKILISGGGRCNLTHDEVRAADFHGNRNAIGKVLRSFDVAPTLEFFASIGITVEREEGGKLFPTSNRARDVIDALLAAAAEVGVEVVSGQKVLSCQRSDDGFLINETIRARRLVMATGGRSVPKTGSDGSGYALVRGLGHSVGETFAALVPLVTPAGHWTRSLSGTSIETELFVRSENGRVLHRERGSLLFTHFGLSGPVVLDISRHWIAEQPAALVASFLPDESFESLEASLLAEAKRNPHATLAGVLRRRVPDRLAVQLGSETRLGRLSREDRRVLIRGIVEQEIPIVQDRGFDYAEVTAGGVPLDEIELRTMASRRCDGLYLCGEILDVDGKIGGYNFQWA
ncbi:MAG: aminoacetone oxidase family FAD-binding enzyme, partial [Thermoanaerobaculia bacterium]